MGYYKIIANNEHNSGEEKKSKHNLIDIESRNWSRAAGQFFLQI